MNAIIKEVQQKFDSIYDITRSFVEKPGAISGVLISGDAGTGKTHYVQKAFIDTETTEDVEYIKGGKITAVTLYAKMWFNRNKGRVIVLDDCDIIHKSKNEMIQILDMLKGATEITKDERIVSYEVSSPPQLIRENNIPSKFDFQGSIVWITNDKIEEIEKKAPGHWAAISSRFNIAKVYLNDQEKLLYTLHLIENGLLGEDCKGFDGGYSDEVVKDVVEYINTNYRYLNEITPRIAMRVADVRNSFPNNWKTLCNNQMMQ